MTIKEYQNNVDDWIQKIGVRYFNEMTNLAILTEEVGEVARIMSRIYGEQSFKNSKDKNSAEEKLGDELCDVLFVITCIANQTGIDLSKCIHKNFKKKTSRDKDRHAQNIKL